MIDCIIYPQPTGPIAVVVPVALDQQKDETERDALVRHARRVVPEGVTFAIVPAEAMPADRVWRNVWAAQFGAPGAALSAVSIDMDLAREVHRTRLRAARAPQLAALDTEFPRALEVGDDAARAQIVARKAALRDAPTAKGIRNAKTPEALIASIDDAPLRDRYARPLNSNTEAR